MQLFGGDFKLRTNLLATARTTYNFKGPFGESYFFLTTPTGTYSITFNASSMTYQSIIDSTRPNLNKAKFAIPEQSVINEIEAAKSPQELLKKPLDPQKRFWSIDFINIQSNHVSTIRKPSNILNLEVPRPTFTNLYQVKQAMEAAHALTNENHVNQVLTPSIEHGLVNFRMRAQMDKRLSLILSGLYLMGMGSILLLSQRRRWEFDTLANHLFYLRGKALIVKAFPQERSLVFNKTSLKGLYQDHAEFQIQFSGQEAAGTAFFNVIKGEGLMWKWEKARVEYRTPDETHLELSLMDWAKGEQIRFFDSNEIGGDTEEDSAVENKSTA
jgi:hypothetical protein